MFMQTPILYIVVPCYNEEEVIHETAKRLDEKIASLVSAGKISDESRVMFVDDGSKDKTWQIIEELNESNKVFRGAKLSRNRGHQNALLGGLMTAKEYADVVISMDADLQDDINAVDGMIDKYYEGCEVVYGVRSSRKKDTFFKKFTAEGYYKLMALFGVDIVFNHADYRLLTKRALEELSGYRETNLFLRGIVPLLGFKSDTVEYERHERFAGESKYPLKKMLAFAFDGITSFSTSLIRLVTMLGFGILAVSILVMIYYLVVFAMGKTVQGWATIVCSIWLLGGVQLLCIGLIGEYIGKIYAEVKDRPRFIIEKVL